MHGNSEGICCDFCTKIGVDTRYGVYELAWCMVVVKKEEDEPMVDTAIGIRLVQPAGGKGSMFFSCFLYYSGQFKCVFSTTRDAILQRLSGCWCPCSCFVTCMTTNGFSVWW